MSNRLRRRLWLLLASIYGFVDGTCLRIWRTLRFLEGEPLSCRKGLRAITLASGLRRRVIVVLLIFIRFIRRSLSLIRLRGRIIFLLALRGALTSVG